jgi:tubulin polyglutamylase TTLL6/13
VAQEYLNEPFLIDDLKFDLRIYVLLTGVNPLRIYIFDEGLARFATQPYEPAKRENLDNLFMHLTNYAINKHADGFIENNDEDGSDHDGGEDAHKRSLSSLYAQLKSMGHDIPKLQREIEDICIKTIITSQPSL